MLQYKIQVILRPTASRPVYLRVRHPFRTRDQCFLLLYFFLDRYGFSDVTRRLVCSFADNKCYERDKELISRRIGGKVVRVV
jgi:hypothetical protein